MHKISYVLVKDLVKIRLKLTFASNILLELEKITYPSMTLVMPANSIQTNSNM